ncbi:signal peptidase I [Candidatus Giovannonibacteria bacterium]|nr:signal peptidase I [Candidatus Giovannonibacteria bacterium]
MSQNSFWRDFLRFIIVAAIIIIPVRTWVAQPFLVKGASMEPTFEDGEYLIIDELTLNLRSPERGEVLVFRYPVDPSKFFIKRVIGLPGETIRIKDNKIFLVKGDKDEELREPFLREALTTPDGIFNLGEKEYFMLGDNRLFSHDSRKWGILNESLIVGRAFIRLWPPPRIDFLPGNFNYSL